jgi:macrolide transport system ATP-binding/permease protein
MRALSKVRLRIRSLLRSRSVESELETELRFHFDQQIEENLASGMSADEARRAALRTIGSLTQYKEECRDMRRVNLIEHFIRDLRYAVRSVRRRPGFTLLAVLVMGLGIGANTAVFSVVDAVLLKPLAYRGADRIVTLSSADRTGASLTYVSAPDFRDWREQCRSFDALAYYKAEDTAVLVGALADYAHTARVSPEFFGVFGVSPSVGRSFTSDETTPGSGGAALLSEAYWQSRFGGRGDAVGQEIRVFGKTLTVVGILPRAFQFPDKTDVWIPTDTVVHDGEGRGGLNRQVVGLLKKGVSVEEARSEMALIATRLAQQYPDTNEGKTVSVVRLRDDLVRNVRLTLYLLLGTVGLVLLIACANVATLLLAKASARTRKLRFAPPWARAAGALCGS